MTVNKVVINTCYGGFGLSDKAKMLYDELTVTPLKYDWQIPRHDPALVYVVGTLGKDAWDEHSKLEVKEIVGNKYRIREFGGKEELVTPETIGWIEI